MMLTMLVEVIMSVFIANFKAAEHPILNIVIRGFLIAIVIFVLGIFSAIKNSKEIFFIFGLSVSLIGGFCISLFLFLIDKLFSYFDKK